MLKNDYILDLAESLGKALGKGITQKKDDVLPISIENLSDKDMIMILLKHHIQENRFNDAENALFDYLEKTNTVSSILEVGEWFYTELMKKSAEELAAGNFTTDEVIQGVEDFKTLLNKKFGL